VRHRGKWLEAKRVRVNVPVKTIYRGLKAAQPKAFLECVGPVVVKRRGMSLNIEGYNPVLARIDAKYDKAWLAADAG
jgi:hypothetical protein